MLIIIRDYSVQDRFYPSIPFDPDPLNKSGIDKIVVSSQKFMCIWLADKL